MGHWDQDGRKSFFRIKTKLWWKNELGYEQDLSMLFSNHPYFLMIGFFSLNGGWHAVMEKLKDTFSKDASKLSKNNYLNKLHTLKNKNVYKT